MTEPFHIPTIPEIRAWVESLPPDEIAGTVEEPNHCLVARAAEHLNPGMMFEVAWADDGSGSITRDDISFDRATCRLPDDINHLAERFDALGPFYCERCDMLRDTTCDLTAAEVLAAWPRLVAR